MARGTLVALCAVRVQVHALGPGPGDGVEEFQHDAPGPVEEEAVRVEALGPGPGEGEADYPHDVPGPVAEVAGVPHDAPLCAVARVGDGVYFQVLRPGRCHTYL
jgi:hypothetical protein